MIKEDINLDELYQHPIYKDYYADEDGNVLSTKYGKRRWLKMIKHSKSRYRMIYVTNKKKLMAHRFLWECYHQREIPKGMVIDHINNIGTDNKKCNLQMVTMRENQRRYWSKFEHGFYHNHLINL